MKPTKNQIYCPYSCRPKMVFETKEKALKFLQFNAKDFEDENKIPKRPYFCSACGGWHLSSQERAFSHVLDRNEDSSIQEDIDMVEDKIKEIDGEEYVPKFLYDRIVEKSDKLKERRNIWEERCISQEKQINKLKSQLDAYKMAEAVTYHPEWIPVTEETPFAEGRYYPVLATDEGKTALRPFFAYWSEGKWWRKKGGRDVSIKVVSWYPHIYKEKE